MAARSRDRDLKHTLPACLALRVPVTGKTRGALGLWQGSAKLHRMSRGPIHFVSLGCAKNRVDTELMLGVSAQEGEAFTEDAAEAETIVVNTCGFIGSAKQESIDTVLEMAQHKAGRCKKLIVTGCLSQRYEEELAQAMPEVDHFLGSSDMLKLGPILRGETRERRLVGHPAAFRMAASDPRVLSQAPHSAYVKIAEGCNRVCAFCAIPGIRGKQRSRPIDDIVTEVRQLVATGTVEVNLVSQDTVAYGRDLEGRPKLAELLRALDSVEGLRWVRVHYLYPESLTDAMIEVFGDPASKTLPYVDMPLQHASEAMLKRMRRGHSAERMVRLVERLRERIPGMTFRTTFIVGHPGETEADFQALMDFVRWGQFDHVGTFLYSHEEGTEAGGMTDLVPEEVAEERRDALMALQQGISAERLARFQGATLPVLVDGPSEEHPLLLQGRHAGQALEVDGVVHLTSFDARPGDFVDAHVTHISGYDLVAEPPPRRSLPLA